MGKRTLDNTMSEVDNYIKNRYPWTLIKGPPVPCPDTDSVG